MEQPRPGIWSRRFVWDGPAARASLWRHRVAILLGLGVAFRVAGFLAGRGLWMDEGSLIANARLRSPSAFFGPLVASQLAPPGFLTLEWVALRVFGDSAPAARIVPLLAGIASLWLFLAVARRMLTPRAIPAAVALFASADDLIYFASEAKQYSSDVASALACTLIGVTIGVGSLDLRRALVLSTFGVLIVWFSHPSIFVLAAVGTVRLADRLMARDWRSALAWCLVGATWVASFAGVHAVAMVQLGPSGMMWQFWGFAFPPFPGSVWDASWVFRRLAYFFVNPLHFTAPFGPLWSSLPAVVSCLVGVVVFARSRRDDLALLLLPVGFALAASCLKLYPFHGRLVLFLTPAFLLLIASGLDRVRDLRPGRNLAFATLAALLIGVPMLLDLYRVVEPRQRETLNPYGDRRPLSLDPYRYPF